jgi:hypothetical protein
VIASIWARNYALGPGTSPQKITQLLSPLVRSAPGFQPLQFGHLERLLRGDSCPEGGYRTQPRVSTWVSTPGPRFRMCLASFSHRPRPRFLRRHRIEDDDDHEDD